MEPSKSHATAAGLGDKLQVFNFAGLPFDRLDLMSRLKVFSYYSIEIFMKQGVGYPSTVRETKTYFGKRALEMGLWRRKLSYGQATLT
jgi:hypothetical protein